MSVTYDYDVFISCDFEDNDSAMILSRKLSWLDFLVWCDIAEAREGAARGRLSEAVEHSAACVLLLGAGERRTRCDESVYSAIHSKVESTQGLFRPILVALPGADVVAARALANTIVQRSDGHLRRPPAVIQFKENLDEESVLHELILSIRGLDPCEHAVWPTEQFGESARARLHNALDVDWHKLLSDVQPAALEAPDWSGAHLDQTHPADDREVPVSAPAFTPHYAAAGVTAVLMLLVAGMFGWSYFASRRGESNAPTAAGSPRETIQTATTVSGMDKSVGASDKRQSQETESGQDRKRTPSRRSSGRRGRHITGPLPGNTAGSVLANGSPSTDLALEAEIGKPESGWLDVFAEDRRRAFGTLDALFIEGVDATVIDKAVFFKTVSMDLQREGIRVLYKEEDRGFANVSAIMRTVDSKSNHKGDQLVFFTFKGQRDTYLTEFDFRPHPNSKLVQAEQLGLEFAKWVRSQVKETRSHVEPEPKSRGGPRAPGIAS